MITVQWSPFTCTQPLVTLYVPPSHLHVAPDFVAFSLAFFLLSLSFSLSLTPAKSSAGTRMRNEPLALLSNSLEPLELDDNVDLCDLPLENVLRERMKNVPERRTRAHVQQAVLSRAHVSWTQTINYVDYRLRLTTENCVSCFEVTVSLLLSGSSWIERPKRVLSSERHSSEQRVWCSAAEFASGSKSSAKREQHVSQFGKALRRAERIFQVTYKNM